jgi:hypothetical protein
MIGKRIQKISLRMFGLQRKPFLSYFKNKLASINKGGDLILHPDLATPLETNTKNFLEVDEKIASDEYDLEFIKLNEKGVPIIIKNYYDSLGVKQTATSKEIKINFLKIAKKFHPDKHPETLV